MRLFGVLLLVPLLQFSQVLTAPDPAQMEQAPSLGYRPVAHGLRIPADVEMGAPSSVAWTIDKRLLVFNRGPNPLMEFDEEGRFVRAWGQGEYVVPHGMRLDPAGNIWTTDVSGHTVTKMSPDGTIVLRLGVMGQAGEWNVAANQRLLDQPTDLAFGAGGEIFVLVSHGRAEPRVLKFDPGGRLLTSWGSRGTGPGQFDTPHSVVVDVNELVYIADRQNRRVQIFTSDGTYLKEWTYRGLPCGLHLTDDQQLYMVSGFAGELLRLDENGIATGAVGQPGKGLGEFGEAHYLSIGPDGAIYVTDTVRAELHKFVRE